MQEEKQGNGSEKQNTSVPGTHCSNERNYRLLAVMFCVAFASHCWHFIEQKHA
jgi:hypothetical protein